MAIFSMSVIISKGTHSKLHLCCGKNRPTSLQLTQGHFCDLMSYFSSHHFLGLYHGSPSTPLNMSIMLPTHSFYIIFPVISIFLPNIFESLITSSRSPNSFLPKIVCESTLTIFYDIKQLYSSP